MPPPLLFIPGVLCDYSLWKSIPQLLEKHAAISFPKLPSESSISEMASVMLKNTPSKFIAVGFSLGGWIALEMAKIQPEAIAGLVLISTSNGKLAETTKIAMRKAIQMMHAGNFSQYITECIPSYLTKEHSVHPILQSEMRSMMQSVGSELAIKQYQAILQLDKPFNFLANIRCPTLIIRGEQDARHPITVTQELTACIPNSTLKIIKDAAHFVPFEQPDRLGVELLQFLKQHQWHVGFSS